MTIDYDRLRELAGKAGPGPWTVEINDWDEVIVANDSGHAMSWGEQVRFEMKGGNRNVEPHLIALAPDMARELLRLRRELTDLRARMLAHEGYLRRVGQNVAANYVRKHERRLAQIIQGDTE